MKAIELLREGSFLAQTACGTAGRDERLVEWIGKVEAFLNNAVSTHCRYCEESMIPTYQCINCGHQKDAETGQEYNGPDNA